MRAGPLDRLITIQRNTPTSGEDGQPSDSWATVGVLRRHASMRPVRGEERFMTPQFVALEQIEFRIRYSGAVANLNPLDRIIYPALTTAEVDDDAAISGRRIHDVMVVHEIGRREGLLITTSRRVDVLSAADIESEFTMDFSLPENSGYLALLEDI